MIVTTMDTWHGEYIGNNEFWEMEMPWVQFLGA